MIALALSAFDANAYPGWDGNRLLEACTGVAAGQQARDCEVFIRSAIDRYHELLATRCAPRHVGFGEIVGVVVRYLQDHPAERQLPANDLILASLKGAYCGPGR